MSIQYEAEYRSILIAQFRALRDALGIILLLLAINILTHIDVIMYISFHKLIS